MAKWTDFGNIWSTLREVDVSVIRAEAERPLTITCIGHTAAIDAADRLLHTGDDRYGPVDLNPVETIPFEQVAGRAGAWRSASLLIVALDARTGVGQTEADALAQVEGAGVPTLLVVTFGTSLRGNTGLSRSFATPVIIPDPNSLDAADKLGAAVLERLPAELHLTASRRLPGLRVTYARELINSSSFTNATYAIGTALPEQIPVLNVPFALADIVVLTKNQAIMVYRLALAYGAKPDFQERLVEIAPVIGGGFLWRQLARTLVSLVPVWGVVPKVAIAYAGTYATGVAAWGWFARGEMLSRQQLQKITNDAMALGRQRAKELADRARSMQPKRLPAPNDATNSSKPSLRERVQRLLPKRNKQKPVLEDQNEN